MITKHTCLDGADRQGEEFDCPTCRALLLKSMSNDNPEPQDGRTQGWFGSEPLPVRPPAPPQAFSHPSLGGMCEWCDGYRPDIRDHVRNVHPEQFNVWTAEYDPDPFAGQRPPWPNNHRMDVITLPHTDGRPGGLWRCRCSCGWRLHGHFARTTAVAEQAAQRLAVNLADQHINNPALHIKGGCPEEDDE